MFNKKFIAAAFAAMAMASASAVPLTVTLNPNATNGGPGNTKVLNSLISAPGFTAFTASGAQGNLGSSLSFSQYLNGAGGPATYIETGTVKVTSFTGGNAPSKSWNLANPDANLFGTDIGFGVYVTFTLSGGGFWAPTAQGQLFTATSALLTNANVYGVKSGNAYTDTLTQNGQFLLGTLALNPSVGLLQATALVSPTESSASTNLNATFSFTPAAGTAGPNGFWSSPADFNIDFFAANLGSGVGNTTLTPNPASNGAPLNLKTLGYNNNDIGGAGSVNISFQNRVPEPGALALVGLALAGVALARRKKI